MPKKIESIINPFQTLEALKLGISCREPEQYVVDEGTFAQSVLHSNL